MVMTQERKQGIIKDHGQHGQDTGSPEVQVALLTERITYLTEHLKGHRKDYHSRRGLLMMVNRRNRLLRYLRETVPGRYQAILSRLNLRARE